jgi:IS1 family transposase
MRRRNKLPLGTRVPILTMLVEGSSLRRISRVCDVPINTVTKFLVDAGRVCAVFHDEKVRNVKARRVQVNEIWSFTYAKQKNVAKAKAAPAEAGDNWTWTAIDVDTNLIISWLVGGRDGDYAMVLMDDLLSRLANRVQLTSDGDKGYLEAVEGASGSKGCYSPAECTGIRKTRIEGNPDPKHVSTSYAERHNLNMRMQMRGFTRLTTGYSKNIQNHAHMVALYTLWYNWIRTHKAHRVTPAMAAGLTDKPMDLVDVTRLIDDVEMRLTIQQRVAALALPPSN